VQNNKEDEMTDSTNVKDLLKPEECVLAVIDHQPQMSFMVRSHDLTVVRNNVVALVRGAKLFKVPVVLTTVASKTFSGALWPEIQAVFPEQEPIDRTSMNSWEDKNFKAAVEKTGKKSLIIAGLWTEVCVCFPAIQALRDGYDVYIAADSSGDISMEAHDRAIQRMIQAGAVPMTSFQLLYEWQRDWARTETYDAMMQLHYDHSSYGIGVRYAKSILGEHAKEG
jgi:nicotinamidase-related amidase